MLDKRKERMDFLNKLKEFGLQITTEGTIIDPIKLDFNTLYEKILWLLNESPNHLTVNAISSYLGEKNKSVSKAITKLWRDDKDNTDYLRRITIDRKRGYKANIPKNIDIPSAFKVMKDLGIRKQNKNTDISPLDQREIKTHDAVSAIRELLSSGEYELVIRRNSSA